MKFETETTHRPAGHLAHAREVDTHPHAQGWTVFGYAVTALLVLVPVIRMTGIVLDASKLQYNDYWQMLPRFTTDDGGLDIAGLFEFQNHPVVVPQLLYWINIQLFAGSNVTLGLLVVAFALGILGTIVLILRGSVLPPVHRMAVMVLTSCLLFTPSGTWNYAKAMSGTAWLSSGLFAIVAVYLRSRDRVPSALGVSVLAAVSYGTGLMVWPAVAAVGACRRPVSQWWREWPCLVGFVATYSWYRQVQTGEASSSVPWPGLENTVRVAARLLSLPLGLEGSVAEWVGLAMLIATTALVVRFAVSSDPTGAAWAGIAVFGLSATIMLAVGRYQSLSLFGEQHRYSSIPSFAWMGFAGLGLTFLQELHTRQGSSGGVPRLAGAASAVMVSCLAVVAFLGATSGSEQVERMRGAVPAQELREVALRLDIADGSRYLVGPSPFAREPTSLTDLLRTTDHHPFTDGWDLDCGLIGERLDPTTIEVGQPAGQLLSVGEAPLLPGAPEITGRITSDRPIRCVIITDETNEVVGAATLAVKNVPDTGGDTGATGFRAIARPGSTAYRAYVVFDDDQAPVAIGEIDADDIEAG